MTVFRAPFISLSEVDFSCESETFVHINLRVQGIGTGALGVKVKIPLLKEASPVVLK